VKFFGFTLCAAALLIATAASAETVSIPAAADTTLHHREPNNNMGGTNVLQAGTDGSNFHRRALVRFDVAAHVPPGATIDSATLNLFATSNNQTSHWTHELFRVSTPWGEGTGTGLPTGQPAQNEDATWNSSRHNASVWSAPGGAAGVDYPATPSASQLIAAAGAYQFHGLAADVQTMLDTQAANHGWMLISRGQGTTNSSRQFESRETTAGHPPMLTIEYTPIPEPATSLLVLIALAAVVAATLRRGERRDGNMSRRE
jgi:hypothetical protein